MALSRKRALFASSLIVLSALTAACVDLFHSTDFATLCTTDPTDPRCLSEAGPDSAAGPGKDSGVDATRPHPDFCSWSRNEVYKQATLACARLGAYGLPISNVGTKPANSLTDTTFGQCLISAQLAFDCTANATLRPTLGGAADQFWSCISTATTEAEVTACVYPSGIETCKGGAIYHACGSTANNTHIRCAAMALSAPIGSESCAMYGRTCAQEDPNAGCAGRQGQHCVVNGCSGTQASDCEGTFDRGLDCAAMSATCAEVSGGAPACKPNTGTTCSPETVAVCTGDKVSACIDGTLAEIDCSALGEPSGSTSGLKCDVTTNPVPLYALANACIYSDTDKCTEADAGSNKCTGSLLTSCARGRTITVDCKSFGSEFSTCVDDGVTPAHCK